MQKHSIKLNTGKSLTAISPIKDCQELAEALFKDKLFVVVEMLLVQESVMLMLLILMQQKKNAVMEMIQILVI